uniref:Uncharacterized protein n=1 Tax=Romanomermis culicivorax TaxID=13658 RepID=A0A915I9H0_ROMCU
MLKVELAAQGAEFAVSIAELTTRLDTIERKGGKEGSPKQKHKSAPAKKPPTTDEGCMDE